MRRLRQKWNSQSGASLLLALLFFLVCMMAAASVLTAAVSNAGKIRSNYEEQQKYLALSSALRLVAGEIEGAKYTGKYTIWEWEEPVYDDEGREIDPPLHFYHVRQMKGDFTCGLLSDQLSFQPQLDDQYFRSCAGRTGYSRADDLRDGLDVFPPPVEKTLTVTIDSGSDPDFSETFPPVKVEIKLNKAFLIRLTATLEEDSGETYRMEAELAASGLPSIEFTLAEEGALPSADPPAAGGAGLSTTQPTDFKWKLSWIAKEVAGG